MPMFRMVTDRPTVWLGILLGGLTGLCFRLFVAMYSFNTSAEGVMTLSFLALGPFAVGWVSASMAERSRPRTLWMRIVLPWPAMLLSTALAALLNVEGLICVVFALPIALVFASLGGLAGGAMAADGQSSHGKERLAVVLLLPVLLPPLESRLLLPPTQLRTVETELVIAAPPAVVWCNIERVHSIDRTELRPSWTHAIGFPARSKPRSPMRVSAACGMPALSTGYCLPKW